MQANGQPVKMDASEPQKTVSTRLFSNQLAVACIMKPAAKELGKKQVEQ